MHINAAITAGKVARSGRKVFLGIAAASLVGAAGLPVTAWAAAPTVATVAADLVSVSQLANSSLGQVFDGPVISTIQAFTASDWNQILFGSTQPPSPSQQTTEQALLPMMQQLATFQVVGPSDTNAVALIKATAFVTTAEGALQSLNTSMTADEALSFLYSLERGAVANTKALVAANAQNPSTSPINEQTVRDAFAHAVQAAEGGLGSVLAVFSVDGAPQGQVPPSAGGSTGTGASAPGTSSVAQNIKQFLDSFKTLLNTTQVMPSGGSVHTTSGSQQITLTLPSTAGTAVRQVTLSATDGTGNSKAVLPTSYQLDGAVSLQMTGVTATYPAKVTVKDTRIQVGTVVYALTNDGLQLVTSKVTAGQASFELGQSANLIFATPQAAPKMKSNQRDIQLNGKVQNVVPAVVHSGTTYMPIWYVGNLLKSLGITPHWDGTNWTLTSSAVSNTTVPAVNSVSQQMGIYLNGKRVENVVGVKAVDPSTGNPTTYMPIWYVMQILNHLNLPSQWDGHSWFLAQTSPALPQ